MQVSKFYSRAKPTKSHLKRTLMIVLRTKKHWSSTTICGDILETFQVRSSQFSDFWIKLTPLSVILVILGINTVSIQFSAEIDRSHEKEGQISQSVQIVESNVIRSYCSVWLRFSVFQFDSNCSTSQTLTQSCDMSIVEHKGINSSEFYCIWIFSKSITLCNVFWAAIDSYLASIKRTAPFSRQFY